MNIHCSLSSTGKISFFVATGNLSARHLQIFARNPLFKHVQLPQVRDPEPLENRFTKQSRLFVDFVKVGLSQSVIGLLY